MKQWTKNNMKLLSKWRASKRAAMSEAASSTISMQQRQSTPRQQVVVQEVESTAGNDVDEPMGPIGCCPRTFITKTDADYHPYDEDKSVNTPQKGETTAAGDREPQQPIFLELFAHFRRRSWKKKLLTFLVVLTIVPVVLDLFVLKTGHVTGYIDAFLEWMGENPLLGVWAYISMLVVTSLIFIPPSILIFAAGFTFQSIWGAWSGGILIALVASFLGSVIGGLIGFWRAKYMTRDLVEVLMRRYPLIKAVDAAIVKNSLRVMMLMRLNCLIPFGVLNYVFGITGVDWAVFLLAMVGIVPWHFLLVFLGASAETMYDENVETTLMGVILIATGIAFCIIGMAITWKFAKKELQKEVDSAPPSTAADYRLTDQRQRPWRSSFRTEPGPSVEDADMRPSGYCLMQCLGEERNEDSAEVEYGIGADDEEYYQTKLNWNEIILDDFS